MPPVVAAGALTLDFWARYGTEATYDGWVVEVSSDNGAHFANIGDAAWLLNGYDSTISAGYMSPIGGQRAFSGSTAANLTWTEHIASIAANAGDSVIIRFTMASDSSVGDLGVWIDDVCVGNIQPGSGGVCCRGATCTSTIASGAACASSINGASAGAVFFPGATCNAPSSASQPCCYADYDKMGGVQVADIFGFLNDWFAAVRFAVVGGDGASGTPTTQGIFDFLNDWFAGCAP
jgi:hypothetical protein